MKPHQHQERAWQMSNDELVEEIQRYNHRVEMAMLTENWRERGRILEEREIYANEYAKRYK